jgi:hypothetical protein
MAGQGSVYRRCGCIDATTGGQLGGRCLRLADDRHGSWYVGLELPAALDGRRRRIRRGGYPSGEAAEAVLAGLRVPPKAPYSARVVALDHTTVAALREHRRRQRAEAAACGPGYQASGMAVT